MYFEKAGKKNSNKRNSKKTIDMSDSFYHFIFNSIEAKRM